MDQECLNNTYTHFVPKEAKTNKTLLRSSQQLLSISMVKMYYNLMHLTNYKNYKWIRNVQTTLIPISSQKRLNPTKNFVEAGNSFVSVSMVKIYHTPMHLTNHKRQRWSRSLQTFIPIFVQKRLKPTNNCLEAVNSF